jgi:hypothetical protein
MAKIAEMSGPEFDEACCWLVASWLVNRAALVCRMLDLHAYEVYMFNLQLRYPGGQERQSLWSP